MGVVRVNTLIINEMVRKSELGGLEGMCVDIWNKVAQELNLDYNISAISTMTRNNTKMMLQQLENDNADVLMAPVIDGVDNLDRFWRSANASVALTPPFMVYGFRGAMFKIHDKINMFLFLQPFSLCTWLSLIFIYFIFSFALTVISSISKRWCDNDEVEYSFCQSAWYFWASFIQLDAGQQPHSSAGKLLASAWSFSTLIVVATYTANLAALFGNQLTKRPLSSVDEINLSTAEIFAFEGYKHEILHNFHWFKNLYHQGNLSFVPQDNMPAAERELKRGKILIHPENYLQPMLKVYPDLYLLQGSLSLKTASFALRKKWGRVKDVDDLFLRYARNGVFEWIKRKHKQIGRTVPVEDPAIEIDAEAFSGLFLLMISLVVLSLFFSFLRAYHKCKNRRVNQVEPYLQSLY